FSFKAFEMRIMFIIHQFMPEFASGTERFTLNVAKLHQRNGHFVEVLTCAVGDGSAWPATARGLRHAVIEGVPVYALPRGLLGPLAELGADDGERARPLLAEFIDGGRYDLAHVTHTMRMLPAVEIVRDKSIPYLVTLTDYF